MQASQARGASCRGAPHLAGGVAPSPRPLPLPPAPAFIQRHSLLGTLLSSWWRDLAGRLLPPLLLLPYRDSRSVFVIHLNTPDQGRNQGNRLLGISGRMCASGSPIRRAAESAALVGSLHPIPASLFLLALLLWRPHGVTCRLLGCCCWSRQLLPCWLCSPLAAAGFNAAGKALQPAASCYHRLRAAAAGLFQLRSSALLRSIFGCLGAASGAGLRWRACLTRGKEQPSNDVVQHLAHAGRPAGAAHAAGAGGAAMAGRGGGGTAGNEEPAGNVASCWASLTGNVFEVMVDYPSSPGTVRRMSWHALYKAHLRRRLGEPRDQPGRGVALPLLLPAEGGRLEQQVLTAVGSADASAPASSASLPVPPSSIGCPPPALSSGIAGALATKLAAELLASATPASATSPAAAAATGSAVVAERPCAKLLLLAVQPLPVALLEGTAPSVLVPLVGAASATTAGATWGMAGLSRRSLAGLFRGRACSAAAAASGDTVAPVSAADFAAASSAAPCAAAAACKGAGAAADAAAGGAGQVPAPT